MAETTHTEWRRGQFREQRDPFHCLLFNSSALYYLQTPTRRYGHASMPPQFLPISGDRDVSLPLSLEWPVWSSSSGNNCHAVHRSLSSGASLWSGTFTLSHNISRAHLRDFFRLLTIGMCHFRYLRNGRCDRHRAEITIMQFIGHSLPVHHFFYGTVRIFTLSHIVSQAVFYNIRASGTTWWWWWWWWLCDIIYSYLIQIICTQLYGFKYFYLILIFIWFLK